MNVIIVVQYKDKSLIFGFCVNRIFIKCKYIIFRYIFIIHKNAPSIDSNVTKKTSFLPILFLNAQVIYFYSD